MKYLSKTTIICLAVLFATTLLSSVALGGAFEEPEGEGPGLKTEGEAGGTKLNGVVYIEFFNLLRKWAYDDASCNPINLIDGEEIEIAADVRSVLRLRKGSSEFATFYAELSGLNLLDPALIQDEIIGVFRCDILQAFFGVPPAECGGSILELRLRNLNEFGEVITETSFTGDPASASAPIPSPPGDPAECHVQIGGSDIILPDVVINVK
ncbi:MAG: hypothetical protein ACYSTI_11770 [Planctomycetota bacterium]|jgi:hypothetical protein